MIQGSTPIQLSQLDISPAIQAGALEQQAAVNLAGSVNKAIENFQVKQEQKKQKEMTTSALRQFVPGLDEELYKAASNDPDVKKMVLEYGATQQELEAQREAREQGPTGFSREINIGTEETPILRNIVGLINPDGSIGSTELIDPTESKGEFDTLPLYGTIDIKDASGRSVTYVKLGDKKVIEFNAPVPEKNKVEEAVDVVKEFKEKFPNNTDSEEELTAKLLRLSGGDNTFEFNLSQLVGGDGNSSEGIAAGSIVVQDGKRYELQEDGSYLLIN